MKKPDITKGEWYVFNPQTQSEYYGIDSCDGDAVVLFDEYGGIWNEADAQAISAVPDMIDALIDLLAVCPIEKQYQIDAFEKGRRALKKAGAKL